MDIDNLATRLWRARKDGKDAVMEPQDASLSVEDAYRLQQSYICISGERKTGWKVGATATPMQENLGLSEPFAGPLLEGTTLPSPATCALVSGQAAIVEVEFVLRMGEDYTPDDSGSTDRLADAVDAVCAGIEVAGVRYAESMGKPSGALVVADAAAISPWCMARHRRIGATSTSGNTKRCLVSTASRSTEAPEARCSVIPSTHWRG